jgi:hypothetical protein
VSEQKKPKDISDLKARLGLKGGAGAAPGAGGPSSAAIPPPALGGAPVGPSGMPAGAAIPPPMMGKQGGGLVPPPGLGGFPGLGPHAHAVPPPPFAQLKPAAPPGPDYSKDPFAMVAPVQGPREVRLIIDEKMTVTDAETGRSRGLGKVITVAIALGTLALGYCTGSTMLDRVIYNRSVNDGREIKTVVEGSAKALAAAQARIQQAIAFAKTKRQADFETAQFLRALKKPIDANAFSRRNYIKFNSSTVDNLFDYYNRVNRLWDLFATHAGRTLADRTELAKAPELATALATTDYGVVLSMVDGLFLGDIVILGEPRMDGENLAGYSVRDRMGRPSVDKIIYRGAELTSENFSEVVMPLNPRTRTGLLAENLSPFRDYLFRLNGMNALMTEIQLRQTQLMQQLSEISNLENVFAFGD